MIKRTHLAIGIFFALVFLNHVVNKFTFIAVVLVASLLPDIDTSSSAIGKYKILRPLQFLVQHRGVFHSLTLCLAVSILLAFYLPTFALPFFLGYSTHLFADSFTYEGIKPFWPSGMEVKGRFSTGGRIEDAIFLVFALVDFVLFLQLIIS